MNENKIITTNWSNIEAQSLSKVFLKSISEVKMIKTKIVSNLFPAVVLALIATFLFFLVERAATLTGIGQVLIILAGMITMAALTAFQRFVQGGNQNSFVPVSFNEIFVSRSISEGLPEPKELGKEPREIPETLSPWDLTPGQLVGIDNSLALAKLRMDIERELRRIAYENQIDIRTRPLGVIGLANELVERFSINIAMVCNPDRVPNPVRVCHSN